MPRDAPGHNVSGCSFGFNSPCLGSPQVPQFILHPATHIVSRLLTVFKEYYDVENAAAEKSTHILHHLSVLQLQVQTLRLPTKHMFGPIHHLCTLASHLTHIHILESHLTHIHAPVCDWASYNT